MIMIFVGMCVKKMETSVENILLIFSHNSLISLPFFLFLHFFIIKWN